MNAPGNLWLETWDSAKPVSARRQKRLFDDTREAEKVLTYLSTLCPGDFSQLLLPNFLHCAISRTLQESFEDIPDVDEIVKELIPKLSQATRLRCSSEVKHYMHIAKGKIDKISSAQNALTKLFTTILTNTIFISLV